MQHDVPRAKKGLICPQFRKDVSKVCHTCMWWTGLQWEDAHGQVHHKWQCAMVMTALTNVDVAKAALGTQAATESFRNEMVVRSGIPPLGGMTDQATDAPRIGAETAKGARISSNGAAPKLIGQG